MILQRIQRIYSLVLGQVIYPPLRYLAFSFSVKLFLAAKIMRMIVTQDIGTLGQAIYLVSHHLVSLSRHIVDAIFLSLYHAK